MSLFPSRLRQLAPPRARDWVRRRKVLLGSEHGTPPSVDADLLTRVARSLLGSEPARLRYANTSGYKLNNAYRIWASDASGNTECFFYKRIDLRDEVYPAIASFPGPVGRPEIHAYEHPTASLRQFLPKLLGHVETHDAMRHEFLLEDLNSTHRKTYSRRDALRCVRGLLELEAALREWMPATASGPVVRYDGAFPAAFLEYTHESLEDYVQVADDEAYVEVLRRWPDVARWYLSETPDRAHDRVHGDYRFGNIFQHRADPSRIHVVDLEFAGYGWIHHDLASLFKKRFQDLVPEALSMVASRRPEWREVEHWRMYQRCRLERGLLDAALLAAQRVALSERPYVPADHARRVLAAVSVLEQGSS